MEKVKSHIGAAEVAAGLITLEDQRGNALADTFAIKGAAHKEVDEGVVKKVSEIDAKAYLIQDRLIAVYELFRVETQHTKGDELRDFRPRTNPLNKALEELGHSLEKTSEDMQQCRLCMQSWVLTDRPKIAALGRCPGG